MSNFQLLMQYTNTPLVIFLVGMVVICCLIGLTYIKVLKYIDKRTTGPVVPFWQHALLEMSSIMMHPHAFAEEQDALMKAVNNDPLVLNDPVIYDRLMIKLHERVISQDPNLRENEKIVAAIYLLAMPIARGEGNSPVKLDDIKLVGSKTPKEKPKNEDKSENN